MIYWDENMQNTDLFYKKSKMLSVSYRNKSYKISPIETFYMIDRCRSDINTDEEIISSVTDGTNSFPYIYRNNKIHFITAFSVVEPLYYIFSDYLYDVFNVEGSYDGEIFVRIEDVHAYKDGNRLREIADYLYEQKVPFMIALIPVYSNGENEGDSIKDNKDFSMTVKYMVDRGGSIILHGYTHQYFGHESGEGFEFWDGDKSKQVSHDIDKWVEDRVTKGILDCVSSGIYPLAFEAPHYAISQKGYGELKKYFSTYVGQYQNNDYFFSTVTYPFVIKNSNEFNILITENLGYIEAGNEENSVKNILNEAEALKIVRDFKGGFFFHSDIDIKYLKQTIKELKKRKFSFFSLYDFDNKVKIKD